MLITQSIKFDQPAVCQIELAILVMLDIIVAMDLTADTSESCRRRAV
jgi:hypothetical protein